jgi:hypothetical protein
MAGFSFESQPLSLDLLHSKGGHFAPDSCLVIKGYFEGPGGNTSRLNGLC